jgi:hypothetical protein
MELTRPRVATAAALLLTLLLTTVPAHDARAANASSQRRTSAMQVQRAATLVTALPPSRFATRKRSTVLAHARRAARLAATRRSCAAMVANDLLLVELQTPATWKRRRVPRTALAVPLGLLRRAELLQARLAGPSCAAPAATHVVKAHRGGGGPKVAPPAHDPEQGEGHDQPLPRGVFRPVRSIGAPSGLAADPHGAARRAGVHASPAGSAFADPLSFFRVAEVGVPPRGGSPEEPTEAYGDHVVWYTGNTSVGLSVNDGRTFTVFDPSTVLPDEGLAFCCDQLVSYSRSAGVFVWVSQYWCNIACMKPVAGASPPRNECQTTGAYNRIRIAVARPRDLVANAADPGKAWTYWDILPSTVGLPKNAWFDRSDMAVTGTHMDWSVDTLCAPGKSSIAGRISLTELAARKSVNLAYWAPGGRVSTTQGEAAPRSFFVAGLTNSRTRVWSWAPYSGYVFAHDHDHASVPTLEFSTNGSDSKDWYDRYGIFPGAVESSTWAGGDIWVAYGAGRSYCTSGCKRGETPVTKRVFDQPAVYLTKVDLGTWALASQRWLWNRDIGVGWPALQTDDAGDVGIALRGAPAGHDPRPIVGYLTATEQLAWALPEGKPFETGDYYGLRPGRTPRSFLTPGQVVQDDPAGRRMHWYSIEFGHGPAPYVAPPTVHVTTPANLSSYASGSTVTYTATVDDPIDGALPPGAITWTEDGAPIGTGTSITHLEATPGTHTVRVTATNASGRSASDVVLVTVQAPAGAISASITAPANGENLGYGAFDAGRNDYCKAVQFHSTAAGGAGPLTYTWSDQVSDDMGNVVAPRADVGSGSDPMLTLCGHYTSAAAEVQRRHDVTLTVTDGTSTTQAFVTVYLRSWKLG